MRIKQLLTKTLLAAAGLCVGASAWADVTPVSQDYSDATADWTSGNTGRYTVDMNDGGYLTVNAVGNGSNGATITGTTVNGKAAAGDDFESSDDFTMIFDLQLTGASSGNPADSHKSSFYIYDAANSAATAILSLNQTTGGSTEWKVNGADDRTVTLATKTWYTFKLSKSESKLYLTVTPTAGGDPVFAQQTITVNSSKGGIGKMIFNTDRYNAYLAIDNVVLRTLQDGDVPTGTATTYTIKYKNESDVTIKTDIVTDAFVDDVVTASAAQMADITYNEQKYIYKSGNENLTCVADAESNVITLVYREAETYTYKVTSSIGTVLANSSDFEGETVTVTYPKYELDGTELKEAATTGTNTWYAYSYTLSANVDETITYSSVATPIENVVFYVEGENITGATKSTSNNANIRSSNGAVGYADGTAGEDDLTLTTLAPGKYKIVANVFTSSSAGGTSTFKLGDNTFAAAGNKSSYNTSLTSDEFTIGENTDLVLQAGGGKTNAVDYVYVVKTGDYTISPSVTDYATFSSTYALDFTSATGVKAYYASASDGSAVTMTKVTGAVAAGTGLLLQKVNGEISIPVAATGTDLSASNLLKAGTGADVVSDAEYSRYVLAGEGDATSFYNLATAYAVPVGKAYLEVAKIAGARLAIVFSDDETTGIANVEKTSAVAEGIYNLNGQRVAAPQKGLYIVNGKKVIKK